jgi:hypothetical protein
MNLKIHNPCNNSTRYYRNYNLFWDQFTEYLKKYHNIEENRFFDKAHIERYPVRLKSSNKDLLLMECEYVIENLDTNDFAILSVSDDFSYAILDEKNNNHLKIVLVSQFIQSKINSHVYEQSYKYSPWIYFPSSTEDLETYYRQRISIDNHINKLFFRGTSLEDRSILKFIDNNILTGPETTNNQQEYFKELIHHKVALSVAGRGELCYRDIECMAVGVPFLRFEFQTELAVPLIPNIHYISIPLPNDLPTHNGIMCDRIGLKHHAEMLENRFTEVVDDIDFLRFIASNARSYYENYLSVDNRIILTYNLLKNSGIIT